VVNALVRYARKLRQELYKNPMICSTVNLLFFMSVILLVNGPR
jgi:hypothetical protein